MKPRRTACLSLLATLAFLGGPGITVAAPVPAGEAEQAPSDLPMAPGVMTRLDQLTLGLQQATVIMAQQHIEKEMESWPAVDGKQFQQVLKRSALAYLWLEPVAKHVQWPEFATWCKAESDVYFGMVNGSIKLPDGRAKLEALNQKYDNTFKASLTSRFGAELAKPSTPEQRQLVDDLATSLVKHADMLLARGEAKQQRATDTQRFIEQKTKVVALRDALVALPKEDRAAALLASGGALNNQIILMTDKVKSQNDEMKRLSFLAAANALMQLSDLATRMGFKEAAICHLNESHHAQLLAQGKITEPVGCRPTAYPSFVELAAAQSMASPRIKEIARLSRDWGNQAYLLGVLTTSIDAKGIP